MRHVTPLPNFLLIGTGKAGTSAVHSWLAGHSQILMSTPKEVQFFSLHYDAGLEWYGQHFLNFSAQTAIGESTPAYLTLPYVPQRIAQDLPGARLVAILRDPVDRAVSDWWMHVCRGDEKRSLARAIQDELSQPPFTEEMWRAHITSIGSGSVRPTTYLSGGYYMQSIRRYFDYFPAEQLLFLRYDDLRRDPIGFGQRISTFLDLKPGLPQEVAQENASVGVWERSALRALSYLPRRVRAPLPQRLPSVVRSLDKRPAAEGRLAIWLSQHFAAENAGLRQFVDDSAWKGASG